jgi:hypothetical protein
MNFEVSARYVRIIPSAQDLICPVHDVEIHDITWFAGMHDITGNTIGKVASTAPRTLVNGLAALQLIAWHQCSLCWVKTNSFLFLKFNK